MTEATKTCPSCEVAAEDPRTGLFNTDCPECQARSMARSQQFAIAKAADKMQPIYRDLLKRIAGDDWEAMHQRVKHWDEVLRGL